MSPLVRAIKQILKKNFKLSKKYGYNIVIKKVFTIITIVLTIFTNTPTKANKIYANEPKPVSAYTLLYTNYSETVNQDMIVYMMLKANALTWDKVKDKIQKHETIKIVDYNSGQVINMVRTGGSNHIDAEALTKEDTEKLKSIWGGFSWDRKGMLLIRENGEVYIVSMHNMPHAGIDNKPGGIITDFRSCNYGKGTNYDYVKNNDMNGHICIHFRGSKTHCSNKVCYRHQNQINELERVKNNILNTLIKAS